MIQAVTLWASSAVTQWISDDILTKAEGKDIHVGGISCRLHTGLYNAESYEPPPAINSSKRKRTVQSGQEKKPEALGKELILRFDLRAGACQVSSLRLDAHRRGPVSGGC